MGPTQRISWLGPESLQSAWDVWSVYERCRDEISAELVTAAAGESDGGPVSGAGVSLHHAPFAWHEAFRRALEGDCGPLADRLRAAGAGHRAVGGDVGTWQGAITVVQRTLTHRLVGALQRQPERLGDALVVMQAFTRRVLAAFCEGFFGSGVPAPEATPSEADRRFRQLSDSGLIGITVATSTGGVLEANDAYLAMLGYSRTDLDAGLVDWSRLTPPEWQHTSARVGGQLRASGIAAPFEKEYMRKDGSRVPVLVGVAALDQHRNIAFCVDLTERKRAEAALQASESCFARLAESGVLGLVEADFDGRILGANDAFLKMIGYTRDDLRSGAVRWDELTPPEWREATRAALEELRVHGVAQLFEKEYLRKDGSRAPALVGIIRVDGERPHKVFYMVDLSDRKRTELALFERMHVASLIHDVGLALTLGQELSATLHQVCDAAVRHLDAAFARVWTLNPSEDALELQASAGLYTHLDGPHRRVAVGQFKIGLIAKECRPHLTNDVLHDPRIGDPEWARREGMVAFAGYPLVVEGELVGVMALFSRRPLSEVVFTGLGSIANAVAVGIHRKRLESAKAQLESQLRQSQKMEAIGTLAGGVAHDFNNLLSVIIAYTEMLTERFHHGDPVHDDLVEILGAGTRAAQLTSQLLAFSRKQVLQPRVADLNEILAGIERMIRRLLGEQVELIVVGSPNLGRVYVDAPQIEQVIVNLSVNARDAMPRGGKLTIETANVHLDENYAAAHIGVVAGPHVMLAVSDTGMGMSAQTLSRIFEPFFTTKTRGQGTGLGLSMVMGIVRQSGGSVWVYSEPGVGTSFKVYLPRTDACSSPEVAPTTKASSRFGTETILVVEDDERVRLLVCTILRRHGYQVLDAQSGGDALLMCEQYTGTIHAMVTDVIMPRMTGRQLAERLQSLRPGMLVMYMSGYTDNSVVHHGVLDPGITFLQKPLTPDGLLRTVRKLLDGVSYDPTPAPSDK